MDHSKLALVATICALAACQQPAASQEEVSQEPATETVAAAASPDETPPTGSPAANIDAAFVTEAMKGDNGEIAIGKLALDQASSQAAKDYGRMLVSEHGAHREKLAALAATAGVPVTDTPSDEAKRNLEELKALTGPAFDRAFKQMIIADHTKDIATYEKQAASGDAKTSALANQTLPVLRRHLQTAKAL